MIKQENRISGRIDFWSAGLIKRYFSVLRKHSIWFMILPYASFPTLISQETKVKTFDGTIAVKVSSNDAQSQQQVLSSIPKVRANFTSPIFR